MRVCIHFCVLLAIILMVANMSVQESVYYVSMEHMNITYVNPDYGYVNATSKRPGRGEYQYFVYAYAKTLKTLDNNVKIDGRFYEFRSNEYRRGFVEMHVRFCDTFHNKMFYTFVDKLPGCPLPPGEYHLSKMAIPDLPVLRSFPFRKARLYGNWTHNSVRIMEIYIDVEIKIRPKFRNKNHKHLID